MLWTYSSKRIEFFYRSKFTVRVSVAFSRASKVRFKVSISVRIKVTFRFSDRVGIGVSGIACQEADL